MDTYTKLLSGAADTMYDIQIFRILIPVLAITGVGLFFYFGMKGVIKKNTISLYRPRYDTVTQAQGKITGSLAVVIGVIYLLIGLVCFFLLGGISYFLFLKMVR